jgi:hypothetical protein
VTTVEFAIVGSVLLVIVFAVIEFSRVIFALNMLQEGARRVARVAAVCPVVEESDAIAQGLFSRLRGLNAGHINVDYLNADGDRVDNPTDPDNEADISFVSATVSGYSIELSIPFVHPTFAAPAYTSTLPRESLGRLRDGSTTECKPEWQ